MPLSQEFQRFLDKVGYDLVAYTDRRKMQVCTQSGSTTSGDPKAGAGAGRIWVKAEGNNMPIAAVNSIAFDGAVGGWVEVGNSRAGVPTVLLNLTEDNVRQGGHAFAALMAQGPQNSPDLERPKHNYTATAAPTINDDASLNYSKNSLWVYSGSAWICVDATVGAAVWKPITNAGDFLANGSVAMTGALNFNGQDANAVNWLNFDDATELTIASGAVTATQTWHRIDTEGDASSDDLDTINGGSDGRTLIFRAENTARTVVVKHGTGNIQTFTGSDITLDETYKVVIAVYDGVLSKWLAFGVGGGGGGGSGTDADAIHINAADEFDTAAQKTTPVANDLLLIEDSEDGYAKKYAMVEDIANSGAGSKQRVVGTVLYENLAPTSGKYDIQDSAFATYDRLVLYLENAESSVNATSDAAYLEYGTVGGAVDTTAANYFTQFSGALNAANNVANEFNNQTAFNVSGSSASTPAGYAASVIIEIQTPGDTTFHKRAFIRENVAFDSGQIANVSITHVWRSTSAIGRIQLRPDGYATDTFTSTTRLTIIGYKKESIGAGVGMAADGSVAMTGNLDLGGNALTNGTVPSSLIQTSEFTSTATGTQNDFAFSNADLIRMNNASDVTITGLAAGKPGQRVTIVSIGAGNVYLAHQNAGSTAANRLINNVTSADTPLAAGKGTATFVYDDTTDRWRLVAHEQGAAIAYTCAWTAVSVNPAIGNGSLAANYTIIGDRCFLEILITMGSTTTYGTGAWRLSLPVAATASVAVGMTGRFRDASVPAFFMIMATLQTTTTFSMATESSTVTDASSPFVWAVNDTIHISGEYRVT